MTRSSHSDYYSVNKMKKKKKEKFEVFEFDDNDHVERFSKRFSCQNLRSHGSGTKKNTKKSRDHSPINKYHFLQSFARGTETVDRDSRNESIDVDDEGCQCTYSVMSPNSCQLGDGGGNMEDAYLISSSSTRKSKQFGRVSSEMSSSPISTFCSDANQIPVEKQVIEPDYGGYKIDDKNMTIKIFPDFIVYRDIYSMESCLTFSCHCIKLEGSPFSGTGKTFYFEWAIEDIINIESNWSGLVETARVTINLKSNNSRGVGNAIKTSGVEQLQFSVYDPRWVKGQEAIKTLDMRYKDKWNIDFDAEMVRSENRLFGQSSTFSPRYISGSDESFEDVIYPKGDPDAVTISKRDAELLRPETFINDTIIDFYIKYLANKIPSDKKNRFHFFNSFFFRKLVDLDKDPSSAHEGKAAFQRVRKWTRKVNLFEKDYIFIPVNYSLHWSLLVICHPGEAPNLEDEESEGTSKVPCILHMDSIKGSHKGLKNLMQSYLCEEWKERHSRRTEDVSSKFLNLRFISLELPQQENLFDCGIFLLHYVELFLEEAPLEFSPFNISKFSKFLSRKWFPPAEASLKRPVIKKLIYEILEDPSQKMPPAHSIAEYSSSVGPNETSSEETVVIFLEKIGSSNKTCHDTASSSSDEKIGISLSETSPLRGDQCFRESGAFSKSSTDVNSQLSVLRRSILSPIEEAEEGGSQVAESTLVTGDCQQVAGPTSDLFSSSHISNLETLGNHEVSMHHRKLDDGDSVSGTFSGSQTFSELEIYEAFQLQDSEGCDHLAEPDKEESSYTSCEELAACVVQDSEEEDSNEIKCISSTGVENDIIVLKDQSTKNVIRKRNNLPLRNDDAVSESYILKATKIRRLKTTEGGGRLTRSLSKLSIASLMSS